MDPKVAFEIMFREALFGIRPGDDGTWFVEKTDGFFNAIDNLSAAQASHSPVPEMSTIAAHTDHARYYMEVSNAFLRGEVPTLDWEGSWKNQQVDEAQWSSIQAGFKHVSEALLDAVANHKFKSQDELTGLFAGVAHIAYHLGAVRQLLKLA